MTSTTAPTRVRRSTEAIVILVGLTLGWVLGITGGIVGPGTAQHWLWAISSIGLLAGAALLITHTVTSDSLFAAGLLLLVVGEAVIHVQGPSDVDAFAAATFAYLPGLVLVALSAWEPAWTRITALIAGAAFGAHAVSYLSGSGAGSEGVLPSIGYGFLTLTLIGWTWWIYRRGLPGG
jgi:hypothetical protein